MMEANYNLQDKFCWKTFKIAVNWSRIKIATKCDEWQSKPGKQHVQKENLRIGNTFM